SAPGRPCARRKGGPRRRGRDAGRRQYLLWWSACDVRNQRRFAMTDVQRSPQTAVDERSGGGLGLPAPAAPRGNLQRPARNRDWWPNQLDLSILRKNAPSSDPMGPDFDYAAEFATLDLDELARDVDEVLTTSQ